MTAQSDKLLAGHPSENLLARHRSEKLLARHRSEKHVDRHLYDIAIIGGGPVGSALALALKDSRLKICVLEARRANTASIDARALALSYGSRLVLERLGIWGKLQDVSNISTIHISQKQSFGRAVLRAEEMNVPELGYVLPYPALQDALTSALQHTLSPGPSDETTDKTTQFWLRAKAQAIIDSHPLVKQLSVD
jgi:hypothetical protein